MAEMPAATITLKTRRRRVKHGVKCTLHKDLREEAEAIELRAEQLRAAAEHLEETGRDRSTIAALHAQAAALIWCARRIRDLFECPF